jgi:nucleotide-binding universal stress UspA family protein
MYERIVVALDGSELAEQILPYIEKLAEVFRPTVTLVRAHEPPASLMADLAASLLPESGPLTDPRAATAATEAEVDAYLGRVEARLSAAGVVTTSVRIDRPAAESILTVARRRHATLIAMTTHGRGGLSRFVFGSVAEAVLRAAHCPVLLLPVMVESRRAVGAPSARERELMLRGGAARPPDDGRPGTWQRDPVSHGGTIEDLRWVPVSVAHPCPVCGSTYGCSVAADTGHVCCRNVPSKHGVDGGGWLHELHRPARPVAVSGAAPDVARRQDDAR